MSNISTFEKSLPIIAKFAPLIATMLDGPAAGTAISILEKFLGKKESEIEDAIILDPNAHVKLKEAEASIRIAEINDVANARAREINGKHDWFLVILAIIIIFGFLFADTIPIFIKVASENRETLNHLQDTFGAAFIVVIGYYFGSAHKALTRK